MRFNVHPLVFVRTVCFDISHVTHQKQSFIASKLISDVFPGLSKHGWGFFFGRED